MLAKLVELSPDEHARLIADPKLIAQITAVFQHASKEKREIAERVIGYRKEQADKLLGPAITNPDGVENAQGRTISPEERQRLAFLQENAVQRILQGASVSWNQLLAQLVEVYKMDFKPRGLAAPQAAGTSQTPATQDATWWPPGAGAGHGSQSFAPVPQCSTFVAMSAYGVCAHAIDASTHASIVQLLSSSQSRMPGLRQTFSGITQTSSPLQ